LKSQSATSSFATECPALGRGNIFLLELDRYLDCQTEKSVAALDAETRKQFDQVYEAILGLMTASKRQ
jgi:hypothetical protein